MAVLNNEKLATGKRNIFGVLDILAECDFKVGI